MIYCVALTGTIASGKSTVLSIFKQLKVPIISADKIARDLTEKGQPALVKIREKLGDIFFDEDDALRRSLLRNRILYNRQDRLWLEKLLHPLIQERIESEVWSLKNKPYCVIEIPLLTDCEPYPYLNRVLLLLADRETQIERLMLRDNCEYDKAALFLSIQPEEHLRREIADDILYNNDSLDKLKKSVKDLHRKYLELANETL